MFSLGYAWNELRRRWGRTLVTAFGLAAGVGLVMGIIGVSQGLSDAQNSVLSPLGSVGTDIIVTRTVAPTTSQTTTTTTLPSFRGGGSFPTGGTFPTGGGGGGGFFARGIGGFNSTDSTQAATLLNNNSSIITDLAKLGKPGTQFTHDFFVPGTLITFPSVAINDVAKIPGVSTAVGALSLERAAREWHRAEDHRHRQDRRSDDLDDRETTDAHGGADSGRADLHPEDPVEGFQQHRRRSSDFSDGRPHGHRHGIGLRLPQLHRWLHRQPCHRGVHDPRPEGLRAERHRS